MHNPAAGSKGSTAQRRLFGIEEVRDEWAAAKRLSVDEVSIVPLSRDLAEPVAKWLRAPAIREIFHPPFPTSAKGLAGYFRAATREYFAIHYRAEPVGLVGAEHIDRPAAKVEMRKLVGDPTMHGKGIGKRATFLFLYYIFVIRKFEKVYVHSMDTNIRNLNLNAKFGFELEGVFLQDIVVRGQRRDVVRMALVRAIWLGLFSRGSGGTPGA
jgi:RimJ/RimL family protein N-acetyltransferase